MAFYSSHPFNYKHCESGFMCCYYASKQKSNVSAYNEMFSK